MEIKIIFEDEELLVLDKPSGMIVNRSDTTKGEKTLQDFVEKHLNLPMPAPIPFDPNFKAIDYKEQAKINFVARSGIVHRLDKETSGILLVAKTLEAFVNLQLQFKDRKVQKTYIALAHGKIEPKTGEISVAVGRLPWNRKRFGVLSGGRESVTHYSVITNYKLLITNENLTLVELNPKTGRTHQIRVHLQYIHHPIFADPLYAGRKTGRNDRKILPRIFLHASKISFSHPVSAKASTFANAASFAEVATKAESADRSAGGPKTNEILTFQSSLPKDLNMFLESLKS